MQVVNTFQNQERNQSNLEFISIRKAKSKDVDSIFRVACSVGTKTKESYSGFLRDDYLSKPKYYQKFFLEKVLELTYFYVAESPSGILGFLMAYSKDQWLKYNPEWIEDTIWNPDFNIEKTDNFIVIDKTAIMADLTARGIGSSLYRGLITDLKERGIDNIFAETLISPTPNFASLAFRQKQNYSLSGIRYENYMNTRYTDLIYHKHTV